MFHNRTNELQDLHGFISSRRSELVIIHGRRGVGKTALIREAIRDQHHLIYQATTQTLSLQMVDMTAALLKATSDLKPIDNPWRALFSRSGFTDDVIALSKDPGERILLYTPEDIYGATGAYRPER